MQDRLQHNRDSTIAELKDENIRLKAANIELTKQSHSFARLILDLQETVKELKIAHSDQLNTDDTGARHNGKNGVCTHI
jgi:hypothetical protein